MRKFYFDTWQRIYMFSPSYWYCKAYRILDPLIQKGVMVVYDAITEDLLKKTWRETRLFAAQKFNSCFIFDDCMGQDAIRSKTLTSMVINVRHNKCSMIALVQRAVGVHPDFRSNVEGLMCFQEQKQSERNMIINDFGIGSKKNFEELYDYATSERRSFLYMNRQGGIARYYKKFSPLSWSTGRKDFSKPQNKKEDNINDVRLSKRGREETEVCRSTPPPQHRNKRRKLNNHRAAMDIGRTLQQHRGNLG